MYVVAQSVEHMKDCPSVMPKTVSFCSFKRINSAFAPELVVGNKSLLSHLLLSFAKFSLVNFVFLFLETQNRFLAFCAFGLSKRRC